jgi:hypothetical protein
MAAQRSDLKLLSNFPSIPDPQGFNRCLKKNQAGMRIYFHQYINYRAILKIKDKI